MPSADQSAPATIVELFEATVARSPTAQALGWITAGEIHWLCWQELLDRVEEQTAQLRSLGIEPGDRVVQWGVNSPEWIILDLALHTLGAVHVPLHPTLSAEQRSRLIEQVQPKLVQRPNGENEFPSFPSPHPPSPLPTALATLQFTSGTSAGSSAQPRAVILTQQNLVSNVTAVCDMVGTAAGEASDEDGSELRVLFLPLSHIYARTCDLYSWLYRGSRLVLAESRETIVRDCGLVRPTAINGVPYFYQKLLDRVDLEQSEGNQTSLQSLLGGRVKRCYSGGAMIAEAVQQRYAEAGIPLLSGYGLSETSPVVTASTAIENRPGTVGRPLPGTEVELAEDGEILVRGPGVMQGYWNDPQATATAIRQGWLQTGDLGAWTDDGFLRIVGRKKEQIVLSTGKNVSPTEIEARLTNSPWIELAAVVGEGHPCLVALVVPNPDRVKAEVRRRRLLVWSRRRALNHRVIREIFQREVQQQLTNCSPEQQVRDFFLLDRAFDPGRGEMTAKLSLRRETIATNFSKQITKMYDGLARKRRKQQLSADTQVRGK